MLDGRARRVRRPLTVGFAVAVAGALALAVTWVNDRRSEGPPSVVSIGSGTVELPAPMSFRSVYARAAPGVVSVSVTTRPTVPAAPGGLPGPLGEKPDVEHLQPQLVHAAGVVIDRQGRIVTAHHVIAEAARVRVTFADGETTDAKIIGSDSSSDLALLRVGRSAKELHPIPFGSAADLRIGDPVLAIGDPFGYEASASAGIVSGLGRSIDAPNGFTIIGAIQTDAAVNHGNSGGALLDARGALVGIPMQIAASGVDANVGVAFALPAETVKAVAAELQESGTVRRPWLGIHGVTITDALADVLPGIPKSGALVTQVLNGGPARAAGIRAGTGTAWIDGGICAGGDAITAINGESLTGIDDLLTRVRTSAIGMTVTLAVVRGGETRNVTVRIDAQPAAHPGVAEGCTV